MGIRLYVSHMLLSATEAGLASRCLSVYLAPARAPRAQ
jgi:hypothetical protein